MKILLTGAAGFIGFHVTMRLIKDGHEVIGIDNLNDYYDVSLKKSRLALLEPFSNFKFIRADIANRPALEKIFGENDFEKVIHLAAQAGVRYSITNPEAYIQSNLVGFANILECCRRKWCHEPRVTSHESRHLVYASSSSVYGLNTKLPFSVLDRTDSPASLYAATKKSNELMASTYSHLYGLSATGLRFFTVFGPWGRPDMALFKFTRAILNDEPIDVYGEGNMCRDFTYIDDVVEGVLRVTNCIPQRATSDERRATAIYNIGNHSPVKLMDFVGAIEGALGKKARINFLPMQAGDVPSTYADVAELERDFNFRPKTTIRDGIAKFVEWYNSYYTSGKSK